MFRQPKEVVRQEAYALGRTEAERAVMAALSLFQNGHEADEKCPRCGSLIEVEGRNAGRESHSVWFTKCASGQCNSTAKGL